MSAVLSSGDDAALCFAKPSNVRRALHVREHCLLDECCPQENVRQGAGALPVLRGRLLPLSSPGSPRQPCLPGGHCLRWSNGVG